MIFHFFISVAVVVVAVEARWRTQPAIFSLSEHRLEY